MYRYEYDEDTGGIILTDMEGKISKEPRPVYVEEMNILGFDEYWDYDKQNNLPCLWAEAGKYFYRGKLIAQTAGGSLFEKPKLEIFPNSLPRGEKILPVNIERMLEKNREVMSIIQQITIKRIYNYWRKMRGKLDCFHVAFSGGKDSLVLLDLVKRALPKSAFIVVFGDTGMEFPDTYKIVDEVEEQCRAEGINFYRASARMSPEESWKIFGPPSTTLRWCCSVHKSAPQNLKIREILGKKNFVGSDFVGVRNEESVNRSKYKVESFGEKQKGQYAHNSILEWNSAEIWNYIFMRRLPINEAYKKGNSRAGCLFCPMTSGKSVFFRKNSYPAEVQKYTDLIKSSVTDENINSYITKGGWNNRRSGRDLVNPLTNYSEEEKDGYIYITVKNPQSDWREWIKTLGNVPFPFDVIKIENGYVAKVSSYYDKTTTMKYFKYVFHKAATCIGCGVCESNCVHGAISFDGGLRIENCKHCLQCHDIPMGCVRYNSARFFVKEGYLVKSINTLADHAPKNEWLKSFFDKPDTFFEDNSLGPNQMVYFKRVLFDAKLVNKKGLKVTDFTRLVKKIGWDSAESLGLILINLVYNNPQIRWYVENLTIGETFPRGVIEERLQNLEISEKDSKSIAKAFGRLCATPLGTVLNFGEITTKGKNLDTLTRTRANVNDGRVILYALYRFAEACENYYQFTLTRIMDTGIKSEGVTPTQIFGVTREEMEQFLNGLSANYPEFINATFTHNLEKISLSADKTAEDVLKLFEV